MLGLLINKSQQRQRVPAIRAKLSKIEGVYCEAYDSKEGVYAHRFSLLEIRPDGFVLFRFGEDHGGDSIEWTDRSFDGDDAAVNANNAQMLYTQEGEPYTVVPKRNPTGIDSNRFYVSQFPKAPKISIHQVEPPHLSVTYQNPGETIDSELCRIDHTPLSFTDFMNQASSTTNDYLLQRDN